jgi:hypothetical protein
MDIRYLLVLGDSIPLSEQTRSELTALRHGVELPSDYLQFFDRYSHHRFRLVELKE